MTRLFVYSVTFALASGCGRLAFEPISDGRDGANDVTGGDTPGTGPFGTPVAVAELNGPDLDDDPTLTGDQLQIFFASLRPGGQGSDDIWTAIRASISDAWSVPVPVSVLNTPSTDDTPKVTRDGLTMYFSSDRPGGAGARDIYIATRADPASAWTAPIRLAELSSSVDDTPCQPADDRLSLYMFSDQSGNGDLFTTSRTTTADPFGVPLLVPTVNTASEEEEAALSVDETILFFSSDRPGGQGLNDLWNASRSSTAVPFGAESPIGELNSTAIDTDPWISADLSVIYFSSTRSGLGDLYKAIR